MRRRRCSPRCSPAPPERSRLGELDAALGAPAPRVLGRGALVRRRRARRSRCAPTRSSETTNVRRSSPNANATRTRRGSSTPTTPSETFGRPWRAAISRTRSACGERLNARAAMPINSPSSPSRCRARSTRSSSLPASATRARRRSARRSARPSAACAPRRPWREPRCAASSSLRVEASREVRRSISLCADASASCAASASSRTPRACSSSSSSVVELHREPVDERIAPLRELEPRRIGRHAQPPPRQLGGLPAPRLGGRRAQLADLHRSTARVVAIEAHGLTGEEAPPADRALVGSCSGRHRDVGW